MKIDINDILVVSKESWDMSYDLEASQINLDKVFEKIQTEFLRKMEEENIVEKEAGRVGKIEYILGVDFGINKTVSIVKSVLTS